MKRTLLLTSILYFLFLGVVWSQTASSNSNGKSLTALNSSRTFQTPKIKVYPNPATHYIKLSRVRNVSKIKVLTLIGSPIKVFDVYGVEEKYNVASLPNGLYLVQLLDAQGKVLTTERLNKR